MMNHSQQSAYAEAPTPAPQGIRDHLNEASGRLSELADLVADLADKIHGPQPREAGQGKVNSTIEPPYSGLVNHAGSIARAATELCNRLNSILGCI